MRTSSASGPWTRCRRLVPRAPWSVRSAGPQPSCPWPTTILSPVLGRGGLWAATGSVLAFVALTVIAAMATAISSVAGVSALAVDGTVDADEFEAFATDVAESSGIPALAFFELVSDA